MPFDSSMDSWMKSLASHVFLLSLLAADWAFDPHYGRSLFSQGLGSQITLCQLPDGRQGQGKSHFTSSDFLPCSELDIGFLALITVREEEDLPYLPLPGRDLIILLRSIRP